MQRFRKYVTYIKNDPFYISRKFSHMPKLIRNLFLEGLVYITSVKFPIKKRIIFLPSDFYGGGGSSSDLRGYRIAEHLRSLGWACTIIPAKLNLKQRERIICLLAPELLFVQQGTHPLNCASLLRSTPYIFDIDDAYYLNTEHFSKFVNLCSNAKAIICSSRELSEWCKKYNLNVTVVWTGAPVYATAIVRKESVGVPIIVWPHHFIEGIGQEDRDKVFRIMCKTREKVKFSLRFIGVQNYKGYLIAQDLYGKIGVKTEHFGFLKYADYNRRISECTLGIDIISDFSKYANAKSFGKALAYLQNGVPMVVSAAAEYPYFVRCGINGYLAKNDEEWVESIVSLLVNPSLRSELAKNGLIDFKRDLSTKSAAEKIDVFLRSIIKK